MDPKASVLPNTSQRLTLCIATNSVCIYYTRHAKYFTYSCLGLLVHCLGLGLGLEPQCLGLGLGLGTYCLAHIAASCLAQQ